MKLGSMMPQPCLLFQNCFGYSRLHNSIQILFFFYFLNFFISPICIFLTVQQGHPVTYTCMHSFLSLFFDISVEGQAFGFVYSAILLPSLLQPFYHYVISFFVLGDFLCFKVYLSSFKLINLFCSIRFSINFIYNIFISFIH